MSKKHHYVPCSLLRNFSVAGKGRTIAVFDKQSRNVYESSIADTGAENDFNTATIGGMQINLEGAFDRLDDGLAKLIAGIVEGRSLAHLTPDDRIELSRLAVIQMQRVKLSRTMLMTFPEQLRQVLRERGLEPSQEVLPSIDENKAKLIALQMLHGTDDQIRAVAAKNLLLYTAPADNPFWISDNPIVVSNSVPYGNLGLDSPGVEIHWPLSRSLLVSFLCPTIAARADISHPAIARLLRSVPVIACDPINVDFYNSLQVAQSSRFVYGPIKKFSLAERMLNDHPDLSCIKTKMSPMGLGGMQRNKRMPQGNWLVVFGARTHYFMPLDSWSSTPRRPLQAKVKPEAICELQRAMGDAPHSAISVYEDGFERHMMREVILTLDSAAGRDVTIRHANPALERMMYSIDSNDRPEDKK